MDDRAHVLEHLRWLVQADSTNPPRRPERLLGALRKALARSRAFEVRVTELGDGCVAVLAVRGTPSVVFNVHVDTVPVVPGWLREPFALTVEGEFAYGLGACDAKGAAAALLAAALSSSDDPVALLFTTDEEAGQARCTNWFIEEPRGFDAVVVAEPTENNAVLAHRGVGTGRLAFRGNPGHSSEVRASANHALVAWAARALAFAEERAARGFDVRLNLGRLEGGEKPNVVAGTAEVRFGVRPPPGTSPQEVLEALFELAPPDAEKSMSFVGEPLPRRMHQAEAARALATRWGVPIGPPVDFWTEASIFSSVVPSLVYGPGSIEQAHTADEYVAVASLVTAVADYRRAFRRFAGLAK